MRRTIPVQPVRVMLKFRLCHPEKTLKSKSVHKGFAGILHFWSVRSEVYPETIYTPEQAREINRQEAGGTSCVRRILS